MHQQVFLLVFVSFFLGETFKRKINTKNITASNYDYQLAFGSDDRNKFEWDSRIETINFKPEFSYFVNTDNELSVGAELIRYSFEPANAIGVSEGEITDITLPNKYAFEGSVYIGNEEKK